MKLVTACLVTAGLGGTVAAAPWRGGLDTDLGIYRSYAKREPRIGGTGIQGAMFLERDIGDRRLAARLTFEFAVVGPLTVRSDTASVTPLDSGILSGRLVVGAAWRARDPWTLTAAIGLGRELYFSPEVSGDSGMTAVATAGVERALTKPRWWRLIGTLRLGLQLDPEPVTSRWAVGATVGMGVLLGR